MANATDTPGCARLQRSRRVVVKIGSALLVEQSTGALHRAWLEALCSDVAGLLAQGKEVILVSSGAVALGARQLGIDARRARLQDHQAAAAVGQIRLAHAYEEALGSHGLTAAQLLLTLDDSEHRPRYLNAVNTFVTLLKYGAVPVVNENDTVATQELRYGDNDRLAARVAQMVSADCLILLSDVDGLYTADPLTATSATHIPLVEDLTQAHWGMAGGPQSAHGSGGMRTKLEAARIAMGAGCQMAITSGRVEHPIRALDEGARATWFVPASTPRAARKQWIAGTLKPKGNLHLDDGASAALAAGRSLLPAGVTAVDGDFDRGDAVSLLDSRGCELGRGLVAYGIDEARAIIGRQSAAIPEILGYRGREELVHRDDLVILNPGTGASI